MAARGTGCFVDLTMSKPANLPSLAELRADIDRIDGAMHRLLMERGEIISRLIQVKRTSESGSASAHFW